MIKKILKINLTLISLFIGVTIVNAEECEAPKNDLQTTNNRVLTCDATSQTTTKFTYPKGVPVEVFKNGLCTITCKEDVLFAIDSAKNVRAGMGFNYPLYMSAQRTCTATYDFKTFDTSLRNLVSQRNSYASGTPQYQNFTNQITNLLDEKKDCDKWGDTTASPSHGAYTMNPTISLAIETSENTINMPYVFKEGEPYKRVFEEEIDPYSSCDLKDNAKANCAENKSTISGWTEVANINGRYTMKDKFIELYTGNISEVEVATGPGKTCKAGDAYFTSFYELTRPIEGATTDNGYSLKLSATNIGNNIKVGGDVWTLNVDCWYTVKNLLFPQGGGSYTNEDENYNKYGSTAFMYRTIDLNTPFPNREPGENWYGKAHLITDNSDTIREKVRYEIKLNDAAINTIRKYNLYHNYVTFDLNEMEKSRFIIDSGFIETNREIKK